MIVVVIVCAIAILSIIIQLASRRKDKYRSIARSIFYRTPVAGKGAFGLGPWSYGDWDLGERVNNEIMAGRRRFAHARLRRNSHHRAGKRHK